MKTDAEIMTELLEKQLNISNNHRLPLAIGIYIDEDPFTGRVDNFDYECSEEMATFPVYDIYQDGSDFIFKCKFSLDDPQKKAMALREVTIRDFSTISNFYIELYGNKYKMIVDGAEFIREPLEDGITYNQLIYVDTTPYMKLDFTSWSNYYAKKAFDNAKSYAKYVNNHYAFEDLDECDAGGGGAAGGAAGGGDAGGGAAVSGPAGDSAAVDVSGTTTSDVLGHCDHQHGEGYFGPGCFHVPSKAKVPLHRWEVCNGGSKRKKGKNGKPKKYAYEKGMKIVVDMFEEDESNGIDKQNVYSKLKTISKGIKSMDDVKAVESKVAYDKSKIDSKLSKSKYAQLKELFNDMHEFIKDVCLKRYSASWFAVSMVAVGLVYIVSPIDLIPDAIPALGIIDDAFVLKLIYDAVKDEFDKWKAWKSST